MPDTWSRRALLASVGAAALAGCLGGPDDPGTTPTGTPTDTPDTRTATPTESPTATPEPTPATPDSIDSAWPAPDHDPGRSNYAPGAPGPTEPIAQLWTAATGASLSPPVIADGTVYVGGDDGVVRAFDAPTGASRWEQSVGAVAATPWLVGGRLFVPTVEAVVALDAGDGTELWRSGVSPPGGLAQVEPDRRRRILDELFLVASHGVYRITGGRDAPEIVALARGDGTERWRTAISDPWSGPVFASDAALYVSTGSNSGIPWTLDPDTGAVDGNEPGAGHDFPAERFVLDGTVYAVDAFFGNVKASSVTLDGNSWHVGVEGLGGYAISGGDDHVYYVADGGDRPGLYALSQSDGETAWFTDAIRRVVGRPAVAGETVLVRDDDTLYCFDPTDGTELWSRPAGDIGERIAVADDVVFTSQGGTVRAFRPVR